MSLGKYIEPGLKTTTKNCTYIDIGKYKYKYMQRTAGRTDVAWVSSSFEDL